MSVVDLELNSTPARLETSSHSTGIEITTVGENLENSPCLNEFFPQSKNQKPKPVKAKAKKTLMGKMLAASATLTVAVTAVAVTTAAPPPVLPQILPPSAEQVMAINYRESYYSAGENAEDSADDIYTPPSYDIAFPFTLNNGTPRSVTISGVCYEGLYYDGRTEEIPVEITLSAEQLQRKGNRVTALYTVPEVNSKYALSATLHYEMDAESGSETQTGSIQTELFNAELPRLFVSEMTPTNSITYAVTEDSVQCNISITDFREGCFEYRVEQMLLTYGEEQLSFGGVGEEPPPTVTNGKIEYSFSFPKPQTESVVVYAELFGDCYFNGVKMNLPSDTFVEREVIFGETYSVTEIPFDVADPTMTVNGVTLRSIYYRTDYQNTANGLEQVLPGRSITIALALEGVALTNGTITADIAVNTTKITDLDLTYAQTSCYAGETQVWLEFSFTMPNENVTAEDVTINGFTFNS